MTMGDHPLIEAFARAAEQEIPLAVLCELTHACNVDCEHCYLDLKPDSKIGAMSTEEWKRVFRELKAEGTLFLTLSGGEVLVRRDWFELATYARSLGFALRFFTNGTLVDDVAADKIAGLKPLGVEISLLGGIAATHDAVARRRGAFDKTIAGIRRLKARGVPVVLKCVVMERNAAEISTISELATELGCQVHFDLEISPKNDGSQGPKACVPNDAAWLVAAEKVLNAKAAYKSGAKQPSREFRLAEGPCGAGRRTAHVGPTGNVHPCTQWVSPVGNLRTSSFREVWRQSTVLQEVRKTRVGDFEACARCELLEICSPCMALSQLERGEIGGPSPTKCRGAEIKAAATGRPGRSAWLLEQEAGGSSKGEGSARPASRREVGLVPLRAKDGRPLLSKVGAKIA